MTPGFCQCVWNDPLVVFGNDPRLPGARNAVPGSQNGVYSGLCLKMTLEVCLKMTPLPWNVLSLLYVFYGFQSIGESFQENNSNLLPFQVRHQARALRRAPRPAAEQPTPTRPVRARAPGCSGGDSYVEKICMGWELVPCSIHMGVSKNNGTPKSSILIGFFIINHPFGGFPLFLETSFYTYKFEWFVHNKIM